MNEDKALSDSRVDIIDNLEKIYSEIDQCLEGLQRVKGLLKKNMKIYPDEYLYNIEEAISEVTSLKIGIQMGPP